MSKKAVRIIFSCILSLFLAIMTLVGGLCHYGETVICNEEYLLHCIESSGFSEQLYDEIVYKWENLLAITGVMEPETILNTLTKSQVQSDALHYINSSYSGTPTLDTTPLKTGIEEKIRQYAYSHNINATPEAELEQNINDLVDACISDYRGAICIPLLPKLLGKLNPLAGYLHKGLYVAMGCSALLLLFIFFLQTKRQDTLYYATISVASGGILLVGLIRLAAHYEIVNRLPFEESALKLLIMTYLQVLLDNLEQYGYLYLIAAGGFLALYLIICVIVAVAKAVRNRAKERNENSSAA